jgi:hypothetical protein
MQSRLSAGVVLIGLTLAASGASAQTLEDAVRLSLDGNLFTSRSTTFEADAQDTADGESVSTEIKSSAFGVLLDGFGVGVGYGVNEHVLLGTLFFLGSGSVEL